MQKMAIKGSFKRETGEYTWLCAKCYQVYDKRVDAMNCYKYTHIGE